MVTLPDLTVHGTELARLLGRLIAFDGAVDEPEINRRLAVVSDDVAHLRRLLVEEGVLYRDRAGTTYRTAPREQWDAAAARTPAGAGERADDRRQVPASAPTIGATALTSPPRWK